MYKFQSDKPNKKGTMDGMLATGPRQPRLRLHTAQEKSQPTALANKPALLDNFNKPEGFSARAVARPLDNNKNVSKQNLDSVRLARKLASPANLPPNRQNRGKKQRSKGWKIFMRSSLVVVILVLGVSGWIFGKAWWNAHKVLKGGGNSLALNGKVDANKLNGEGDGRVNILLMGKGGEAHEGGDLTDSMMIASIDPINNGVTLLSIPRDLWVKPDGLWPMKINAVYTSAKGQSLYKNPKDKVAAEVAGEAAIEKVVEDYMGVPIHYYSTVDFTAFQDAVNAIGGIDVNIPEDYSDPTMLVGKKYFSLKKGPQHLDGGIALAYARSRYGAQRGDFDRGEHQQTIMVGIKDKVLSLGTFSNPVKVTGLLDTLGNRVKTNLSITNMMRLYDLSKKINSSSINHVDLADPKSAVVTTGNVGSQSVVLPVAGIDNYSAVINFVRSQLKDGYIIKENPSIIVLNGSGVSGAAQKRADELKSYGYNVTQVADAPSSGVYGTTLVDNTKGSKKYTQKYLENRLGTKAVKSIKGMDLTPYSADFVVVVGQ